MYRVWTHYISMLLLTVLAGGGLYTSAYFFDTEGSSPNTLGATSLDGLALGEPFNEFICSLGITVQSEFTFENNNALPFTYDVAADTFLGNGCGDIVLTAYRNDAEVYSGPLLTFGVAGFDLDPGAGDAWRLVATKQSPSANDTSCTFDTIFDAYQQGFESGEGFHDIELLTHTITASSTLCAPTVLLQMDKHISGVNEGFEESDFSFRVVGEGVDVIIPHGGSYPLSIGTYTIEELAPPGFVHEDWRIGWYGECRRGSNFITTITIDHSNINHGWLDCQADNQYRPNHKSSAVSEREPGAQTVVETVEVQEAAAAEIDSDTEEDAVVVHEQESVSSDTVLNTVE